MDFGLTEEQQAIQDAARKFAREKIAPDFQQREETGVIEGGAKHVPFRRSATWSRRWELWAWWRVIYRRPMAALGSMG